MKQIAVQQFGWRYGGWVFVVFFTLLPIAYWLLLVPIGERFDGWSATMANLGRLMGLLGFMLYAINLLLSSRMRWLESFFGGLNRVYIAHHIIGGLALCFLLFHPLFLALRYLDVAVLSTIETAARQLTLQPVDFGLETARVQEAIAFNAGIVAFFGMVVLLFITFFVKLPYRVWLFTHKFLGVAFVIAGFHVLFIGSDVNRDGWLKTYFALWLIVGVGCFIYRTVLGNIFVKRMRYKVDRVHVVEGVATGMELSALANPVDFKPGQFVFVRFRDTRGQGIREEWHPFSIASAPAEGVLRLYVKALGDYTKSLQQLQPGTIAEVEGAFGRFSYTAFDITPQVWVAGGIGVTPFLSMARSFTPQSPPVDMFYSVMQRSELLDQKALAEYVPQYYNQFAYHPYVYAEEQAFITAEYIVRQSGAIEGKEIFLCGPAGMMKDLRKQFRAMGVPNHKIHSEEFTLQ